MAGKARAAVAKYRGVLAPVKGALALRAATRP
jgi:hypothetical protein